MKTEDKEQFRFQGRLEIGADATSSVIITIEYQTFDPPSLEINLHLLGTEEEQRPSHFYLRAHRHLVFYSDNKQNTTIEVMGINYLTLSGPHVHIKASAVLIGVSKMPLEVDADLLFFVELVPSGILIRPGIRQSSFTGDINFTPITEGNVTVSTSLGVFEVAERYAHYSSDQYGNKVTHGVQRVAVTGTLHIPKGTDLYSVSELLQAEVGEICNLLTLCYRQPVTYYEIKYITDPATTASENYRTANYRRALNDIEKKIEQDELINYRDLAEGGLDILVQTYKNSERKDELTRTMQFLGSSYKVVTLESSYFLAYSALDLITSGENFLLGSAKWKKIEKSLRSHLIEIAETEDISSVLDSIKEKIPELRRMSGRRRILKVCNELGVNTGDLWPKEGFEEGLKMATGMRDELFHAALCSNPNDLYSHSIRVRILVERILLKKLGWPDENIWNWYDQNLRRINQSGSN